MSESHASEQPIVIHGPLTGDPERLSTPIPVPSQPTVSVLDVAPSTISTSVQQAPAVSVSTATERASGLDALRGLLLLLMNLAFTIPHWGPFPGWMYHMQVPPAQNAVYVELAGLTWRDMLFPGFLFTMSAALPITMGARLAKGMPYPYITWIAIRRAALLVLFALIIGHVNPYWTKDYTKQGNLVAIFGLIVSFAFFVRPRRDWSPARAKLLKYVAWVGVVTVLLVVPTFYGQSFSLERRDDIITSIAFSTVAGTIVWLCTRFSVVTRLAILALVLAGRTAAAQVGWIGELWYSSPATWLYQPWYLDLLAIVIPGTIAGDLLVRWMKRTPDLEAPSLWSPRRLSALAAIGLSFAPVLAVGLYERRYPGATAAAVIAICATILWVVKRPQSDRDRILAQLYSWAAFWLVIGVLLEPLEGGVKKDPQTLGYLTLMTGTAIAALASLLILADTLKASIRTMKPLGEIGQNPLFAYVVYFLGIAHVLWLTGYGAAFTRTWPEAALRGILLMSVVGFVVWLTTKKRLLWRA